MPKHMLKFALSAATALATFGASAIPLAALAAEPGAAVDPAIPGVRMIEDVRRGKDDKLVIPYQKYSLDNGLTVILMEDHSDPLVHVDMTYHVGSAREEIGKSGFAHFFEHMMFNGSKHVANGAHFRIVNEAGGKLNGTTNTDRTNYFETVPSNQLERMLWLEADRLGFLLDAVTQERFEIQRATVKNERSQRMDNQPFGLVAEKLDEATYPEGHPYSWQPIGYVADLDRVDVNDLKAFFLRWYGPNNAALTIGGDFDREQALRWVVKYFGAIPRGPEAAPLPKSPGRIDTDRYLSYRDNVALPMLAMRWPTVSAMDPDEPALDVLMSVIGMGDTSLLYRDLVKSGLAVQAGATHGCQELACTFDISVLPNPARGATLADIEAAVRKTLGDFETRGVSQADLDRLKMTIVAGKIFGLGSVAGKASQLAHYQALFGNPNLSALDVARYEAVTPGDVMRAYEKYVKGRPAVILSVLPQGGATAPAKPDNWTYAPRTLPEHKVITEADLTLRTVADSFDRSKDPGPGAAPAFHPPTIWRARTTNGIEVLAARNEETPTTTLQFRVRVGRRDMPVDKVWLPTLTTTLLSERSKAASREERSERLQRLGSSVSISAGDEYVIMTVRALSEHLAETLEIASEQLLSPAFTEEDFERAKNQLLQGVMAQEKESGALAANARGLLLYGRDNAFAYTGPGTAASIGALSLADVKTFYRDMLREKAAEILVVSDQPQSGLMPQLGAFAGWHGKDSARPPVKPFPALDSSAIYFIDRPGAAQSEISLAKRSVTWDASGDYYKSLIMNFALGGSFNSRLNQNLREKNGFTYGVSSRFSATAYAGAFVASASVRANATGAAFREMLNEIEAYRRDGPTAEELAFTKSATLQNEALSYETPEQELGYLATMTTYGLTPDFIVRQHRTLGALSPADVKKLAAASLDTDAMIAVVVGDRATVLDQLKPFGRRIVELDIHGRPK